MHFLCYCNVLPMSYIIDQQTILFYKKMFKSDNAVLHVLSVVCCHGHNKTMMVMMITFMQTARESK